MLLNAEAHCSFNSYALHWRNDMCQGKGCLSYVCKATRLSGCTPGTSTSPQPTHSITHAMSVNLFHACRRSCTIQFILNPHYLRGTNPSPNLTSPQPRKPLPSYILWHTDPIPQRSTLFDIWRYMKAPCLQEIQATSPDSITLTV